MDTATRRVLQEALALPDDERRRVAELLLDSLSAENRETIEAAWAAEAVRRADELELGQAEAIDGRAALEQLKAQFRPVE